MPRVEIVVVFLKKNQNKTQTQNTPKKPKTTNKTHQKTQTTKQKVQLDMVLPIITVVYLALNSS